MVSISGRKVIIALVATLAVTMFGGCSKRETTDHYEIGIKQLKEKKYEEAIASFNLSIEVGQRLAEAYRGIGIAALDLEDYPSAISAFSRSLINMDEENEGFERDVKCYLASARYDYGEKEKAIEIYSEILEKSKDTQIYYLRGKAYLDQKEYDLAKEDFQNATSGSKDYDLFISVYQAYADINMTSDGDEFLQKAVEIGVEEPQDYYNRGRIYYCLQNYEKAKADLIEAMNNGYEGAVLLLGKVYLAMNDTKNARETYTNYAKEYGESAQSYNGLALCDIADKKYTEALANIQKGIEGGNEQEIQSLLYNEVIVYEYLLDFKTAKDKIGEYMKKYPDDENAKKEYEFLQSR